MKIRYLWSQKLAIGISVLMAAGMMQACGTATEDDVSTETEAGSETETESTETTDTETVSDYSLTWIALGELDNYPELRASIESALGVTTNEDGTKEGILYKNPDTLETDQNTTLLSM
jgi:hypothetical protein